jgi:NADH dehydrogenase
MNPRVVILGAGFGGLCAARRLAGKPIDVTIVDRRNHHLFQPLLYQVATTGLAAPEICQPIRSLFAGHANVHILMDEVLSIDLKNRQVELGDNVVPYDYLIVALGSRTSYFGNKEWESFAPGLKTIDDALAIRSRVLQAFEDAEKSKDPDVRRKLMTIVLVGGGPTGVELAGAFSELARFVLRRDFRSIDPSQTRVVLIEALDRVLPTLEPELSEKALKQLEDLHVEVRLNTRVASIDADGVNLQGGERIEAANIVPISPSPITGMYLSLATWRRWRLQLAGKCQAWLPQPCRWALS